MPSPSGRSRYEDVPESPLALVPIWRERAALLRQWAGAAADGVAHAYELAASELEEALRGAADECVTLSEAATLSGYSRDHIGRLVRTGQLRNYGRKHAPRVRRGDLPVRAGHSPATSSSYDPRRDAQELLERLGLSSRGRRSRD